MSAKLYNQQSNQNQIIFKLPSITNNFNLELSKKIQNTFFDISVNHSYLFFTNHPECQLCSMKWLLRIMQTNSNLPNSPGLHIINQKIRTEQNVRSLFESTSFVVPHRNVNSKPSNSDTLKESSTQTSKTVISLSGNESPRMSPDSLSPKTDYQAEFDNNEYYPIVVDKEVQFSRRACILRYLHGPGQKDDKISEIPENSLTKVFLGRFLLFIT